MEYFFKTMLFLVGIAAIFVIGAMSNRMRRLPDGRVYYLVHPVLAWFAILAISVLVATGVSS